MRLRLLAGTSLLVLGGCGLFLGLDEPTFDGPLSIGDGGSADGASTDAAPAPILAAALDAPDRWSTYAKSGGGFTAGPFDGRFIYFLRATDVDGADAGLTGARVLRYDTQATAFDDDAAWTSYDMEGPLGVTGGHVAAVLDGKYLVIGPRDDAKFIRFDTSLAPNEFGFDTNWEVFDGPAGGYKAALPVDGGLVFNNGPLLTPVEHLGSAFDAGWTTAQLDAGTFGCANTHQGICAGGQLFFGPAGSDTTSCLSRFDPSVAPFGTNAGWDSVDVATLADENAFLLGMVASDQHMYVTQYSTHDAAAPVRVLRKPFAGNLDAGWESEPTNVKNPLTRGFLGGAWDGRYLYFAPYPTPTTTVIFSRYDTQGGFTDDAAWSVAAGAALGIPSNRFWGAVFDGQYVYYPSYVGLNAETPTFARFKAYDQKIAVPAQCR